MINTKELKIRFTLFSSRKYSTLTGIYQDPHNLLFRKQYRVFVPPGRKGRYHRKLPK